MFIKPVIGYLLIFMFISTALYAETNSYQFEVMGGYNYNESDTSKLNLYALGASYAFNEISLENAPWASAEFYEKASYVYCMGIIGKAELDEGDTKGQLDSKSFGLGLTYVLPVVPVFIDGNYQNISMDGDISVNGNSYTWEISGDILKGNVGYYIMDGLAVSFGYSVDDHRNEVASYYSKTKTKTLTGAIKYVAMINDLFGVNLETEYNNEKEKETDEPEQTMQQYNFIGDLFITQRYSIGGGIIIGSGDDKGNTGKTYLVRASGFINPYIALMAEYETFIADDEGEDETEFSVYLVGRF